MSVDLVMKKVVIDTAEQPQVNSCDCRLYTTKQMSALKEPLLQCWGPGTVACTRSILSMREEAILNSAKRAACGPLASGLTQPC